MPPFEVKGSEERLKYLDRLMGTAEVRSIKKAHLKAVFLRHVTGYSDRLIGIIVGLNEKAVERARKAAKNHRAVGKNGRPRLLTEDEEKQLLDTIKKADLYRESMTPLKVNEEVPSMCVYVVISAFSSN